MKPFAAFIDVRYLGFYGIINNGGEADTHPLNAVCTASPTLCGFSNPALQTATSPGCHYSDTLPATRVRGTEGHAPRRGGQDLVPFPTEQPLVNKTTATIKKRPSKLLVIFGIKQPQPNEGHAGLVQGGSPPTSAGAAAQGSDPLREGDSRALCNTEVQQPPVDQCPSPTSDCWQADPLSRHSACRQDQTSAVCYTTEEA